MKKLLDIDFSESTQNKLSSQEKQKRKQARFEKDKQTGYEQLSELCRLGEIDAAKQLAANNSR